MAEPESQALLRRIHDPEMAALITAILQELNESRLSGRGRLAVMPTERQLWKRHTLTWFQNNTEYGIAVAIEAYPEEETGDTVRVSVAPWRATDARAPEDLDGLPINAAALRGAIERAYHWMSEPPPPGRRERRLRSL